MNSIEASIYAHLPKGNPGARPIAELGLTEMFGNARQALATEISARVGEFTPLNLVRLLGEKTREQAGKIEQAARIGAHTPLISLGEVRDFIESIKQTPGKLTELASKRRIMLAVIVTSLLLSACGGNGVDWNRDGVINEADKTYYEEHMDEINRTLGDAPGQAVQGIMDANQAAKTAVAPVGNKFDKEVNNAWQQFDNAVSTAIPSHGRPNPVDEAINSPGLEYAATQMAPKK